MGVIGVEEFPLVLSSNLEIFERNVLFSCPSLVHMRDVEPILNWTVRISAIGETGGG